MRLVSMAQTHFGAPHDDLHGEKGAIPLFMIYGALSHTLAPRGLNVSLHRPYINMMSSIWLAIGCQI